MGVLGHCGIVLIDSMDVDGEAHLAVLRESSILGGMGATILDSADILVAPLLVTPSVRYFFLLLCWLVFLCTELWLFPG